jgi:hypothetical protein
MVIHTFIIAGRNERPVAHDRDTLVSVNIRIRTVSRGSLPPGDRR